MSRSSVTRRRSRSPSRPPSSWPSTRARPPRCSTCGRCARSTRRPSSSRWRVAKWHKRDGDAVKTGETLAEVETDKAVMDLVARADGVLRQVAVAEGQTVPVGSVVAVIAAPGEAVGAAPATAPKPAPAPAPGSGERGAVPSTAVPLDATRVKASPLARRIAKEAGVDLKLVTGTGPGGRVTKRDLESAGGGVPAEARPVAAQPGPQRGVPLPAPRSPPG